MNPEVRIEPETLAAFLDGKLEGEERARVVRHLAASDADFDVFADALRFQQEEEATAAPRVSRRWRWAVLPLAAAALVALLVRQPWKPSAVAASGLELVASLPAVVDLGDVWSGEGWTSGSRGGTTAAPLLPAGGRAFRLGVRSLDLAVSLAAGEPRAGLTHLYQQLSLLEGLEGSGDVAERYRELADRLDGGEPPHQLRRAAERAEAALEALWREPEKRHLFALGRWTEAARLSAASDGLELFERHPATDFLAADVALPAEVVADLRTIDRLAVEAREPSGVEEALTMLLRRGGDLP